MLTGILFEPSAVPGRKMQTCLPTRRLLHRVGRVLRLFPGLDPILWQQKFRLRYIMLKHRVKLTKLELIVKLKSS